MSKNDIPYDCVPFVNFPFTTLNYHMSEIIFFAYNLLTGITNQQAEMINST